MRSQSIGEIFVRKRLITQEQLEQALEKQHQLGTHEPVGDVLVNMGYITERDKIECLGAQWGVAFVDLAEQAVQQEAVKSISQEMARRFRVIPVARNNGKLTLAMKDPNDIFAIDEIRLMTGLDIEPVIAMEEDIINAITANYRSESTDSALVNDVIKDISTDIAYEAGDREEEVSIAQLKELSEEAPIIKLANLIISRAVADKASDIHIEPAKECLRVRYRMDGVLQEGMMLPKRVQASLTSRIKIMANMDIAEKRAPQDGKISAIIENRPYDFRVSTLPSIYGEKVVMRILDKSSISIGLNKLGFLSQTQEQFELLINRTYGIILVTGPTGSGKSTTLFSVLNKLNSGEKNIITIEDPVEYELGGITQAQVNNKAGMTFAAGLRTMLRQDPDIIMVGEMRDIETATIAVEAALTGHLVLSTLHTNDAPSAVTRLQEMGVESFLIGSSIIGVLAQRLLRLICAKCKEPYQPPRDAIKRLGMDNLLNAKKVTFYRGRGCDVCKGTGYKGRIGIYELLMMDDQVRDLILKKSSSYEIRAAAVESGMKSLKEDAMEKILLGMTTLEEALRVIYAG
ncbi:MAG: type II/IV secretion system protein [Armatimonadetes bacterium]|nr:type II/IV secretion system protein [Armatimonadota bacterium]